MEDKYESGEGKGKNESKVERRMKNESGKGNRKNHSKVDRRINMKVGKEMDRINQLWKGESLSEWERKGKELIKCEKEDKCESEKREWMNQMWKGE